MGDRRMFSKTIIGAGRFLKMPQSSRLLYYDLGMYADDDGIVEAFTVMRQTGANEDDLRVLASKGYVRILNEELVTYILDWKANNTIKSDRYHPSVYANLLVQLSDGSGLVPSCIQSGSSLEPEVKLNKDKLGKDKLNTKSASSALEELDLSDELKDALRAFMEMRKQMKKPMSERALQLVVKKLKDMASDERTQIKLINQSLEHGWLTIYPLKEEQRVGKTGVRLAEEQDHTLDEVFKLGSAWGE